MKVKLLFHIINVLQINFSKTKLPLRFGKAGRVWWRTRDSLSHVSRWSDCQKNETVSQISLLFQVLMIHLIIQNFSSSYRPFSRILKFLVYLYRFTIELSIFSALEREILSLVFGNLEFLLYFGSRWLGQFLVFLRWRGCDALMRGFAKFRPQSPRIEQKHHGQTAKIQILFLQTMSRLKSENTATS